MKTTKALLFCFIIALSSCEKDNLPIDKQTISQETKIIEAKNWFDDYKTKETFHPIFTAINYHWELASEIKLDDGSMAITVPITDINQNPQYKGEKILYLYPLEKGYVTVVYELTPDQNQINKNEGFKNLDS
jgi:hypothetical protein